MQNGFRIVCQLFKLVIAFGGARKLDQLHLVELMLADKTARVSARAARFGAEACSVSAVFYRKVGFGKDFIPVQICYGNFGGGDEEIFGIFQCESVFFKLRQLSRSRHACSVDDVRRQNFRIAI